MLLDFKDHPKRADAEPRAQLFAALDDHPSPGRGVYQSNRQQRCISSVSSGKGNDNTDEDGHLVSRLKRIHCNLSSHSIFFIFVKIFVDNWLIFVIFTFTLELTLILLRLPFMATSTKKGTFMSLRKSLMKK